MKKIICAVISAMILLSNPAFAENAELSINAKSCILTETGSGKVLYEQNADEQLPIASVTKIMTLLLIAESVDSGKISLDDKVSVSERAMSIGGSTMFLETGEQITVDEMIKGIAVASANDGAVAMAEFISGSESEFVRKMNERASELGMKNTAFVNTNGLDADGHYSSARDVAIMSRELLKHDFILGYTTIWTDTMRGGKYQLANTNKLIRFYPGANGLKTGSTSKALCCLSASAKRDDMQLVAVVLGAPNSKERFAGARALLDYGFSAYSVKTVLTAGEVIGEAAVKGGTKKSVGVCAAEDKSILLSKGDSAEITYQITENENITAPINKGDSIAKAQILKGGEVIDEVSLTAAERVEKRTFLIAVRDVLLLLCK